MKKLFIISALLLSFAFVEAPINSRQFEITKNLEIFANLYKELNSSYVDDVEPSKLMRIGIEAMLETLDPYTNYISESDIEAYRYMSTGKYDGIGASIKKMGTDITIVDTYENGPAHLAGLKPGDQILAIDGTSLEGKNRDQTEDILKGAPGSSVVLSIKRPGNDQSFDISVDRNEVDVKNVPYYGMLNEDIGYIVLTTFTPNAGDNVGKALKKLKEDQPELKGVVFDLRDNGGGLLREAIQVSNVFLPENELVCSIKGKVRERDRIYETLGRAVDEDIPLAVLINDHSASASEIVSGVIQDLDRGVIIGQRSYGKGLVQNTVDLEYNARLKLTTAKYYIPSGRCIQSIDYSTEGEPLSIPDSIRATFETRNGREVLDGGGIKPDVAVETSTDIPIINYLVKNDLIFHYATEFTLAHDSIADARSFTFDDFEDFVTFVQGKNLEFKTETEKMFALLSQKATDENLLELIKSDLDQMEEKVKQDKADDLIEHREEILDLIEAEIVSRYYLQKGRIEKSLNNDNDVKKAIELLYDQPAYNKILNI